MKGLTKLAGVGVVAAGLLTAQIGTQPAAAQDGQGTCKTQGDPSWSGWTSHEELGRSLERIEDSSDGRVDVEVAGHSNQGREIWSARVGSGDRVMMVTSAIHGNERTGTEALLALLRDLGTGNEAADQRVLDGVTLVAVPMMNPDGGELNRRASEISWSQVVDAFPQLGGAEPAWYFYGDADPTGFDVNRDFNPDLDYTPQPEDLPGTVTGPGFFLTPEARTVRDVYVDLQREFGTVDAYVDLHHMGPCDQVEGEGDYVSLELDYPPLGPNADEKYAEWEDLDQDKSRRYALAIYQGIQDAYGDSAPQATVARYFHPDWRDIPGQARSSFGLNGSGSVLFEVRGQSDDWGQKMKGVLTDTVETGVRSLADGLATGSVDGLDGDAFFDIPDAGWED